MISTSRLSNIALRALVIFSLSLLTSVFAQEPNRQLVQNGPQASPNSKRIALVIGNGAYTSAPPLKNPPNDARDMAATLKTLGFDVTSGINVSQKDMKRLIREFGMKLKNGGSGLFYYAGHGVQSKGRNYLIPVDANIQSEAEVEDSGVDAALVLNFMDDAQNGLNIVILDACRNNPFARSFRSASDGLAQVDAPTGTLIAYATAPGRVASDGTAQNGLYTAELLKQMQTPGISITDMFMRVRGEVMKQTGNKQVPWEASSLVGSFYFAGASSDSPPVTFAKIDPVAFELSYWETIKSSTNADDFKAYLARYPQGQFVELAKNRIANLSTPPKPEDASPPAGSGSATELAFWDSIKNSTSADDYRAYLEKYPNGEFAVLAKRRLAPLEANEKEKAKANEVERNIKTFQGHFGVMSAGFRGRPGKLLVSPSGIQFIWDKGRDGIAENKPYTFSQNIQENPNPFELKCANFAQARTDDVFIREISKKNAELLDVIGEGGFVARFKALSADEAANALAAIRAYCSGGKIGANSSDAANSLTGTTWTGDSAGGDKHYEFQFLSSSEVVWSLKWGRLNDPTFQGTYTLNGNQLRMVFDAKKVMGGNEEVAAVLSENSLTGSWNFGRSEVRPDNGMYKFTVTKASTSSGSNPPNGASSLVGTTWKGDSSGGDKHYQVQFLPNGKVIWNLKWNNYGEAQGIWRQEGNTITLDLNGYLKPVIMTVNGETMDGSWSGGQYKFKLTKVQ
jgi:uncharacterized caspase-like protein